MANEANEDLKPLLDRIAKLENDARGKDKEIEVLEKRIQKLEEALPARKDASAIHLA